MYDIQLIKSRITCIDYAQRVGLPISNAGDRCISPFREGAKNPTSVVFYEDFYYDFADGSGGDVIELCAALKHGGNRGAAIRDLAQITGVVDTNAEDTQEWLDYTHQLNAQTAFYHSQLTEDDRRYLRSRGISDADAGRLMIGRVTDGALRGRLFLPYHHPNGYVAYYATRAMPGSTFPENKYMKQKRDQHSQHIPWGLQTLNRSSDTLVIAEGYFDAAAFEVSGYPVLSAITGTFSRSQIPMVLSAARNFQRVFIVYDNDHQTHAGEHFTQRMSELLIRNNIPFVVGTVPHPYHDVSEYYAAGGDLSRIINAAEDGLTYVCSSFRDFDDLEHFLLPIARFTKRTKLDELFTRLKQSERWNEKSLTSLYKSCISAPPETIIVQDIMHRYQLVYVTSIGFYEYRKGAWIARSDDYIKSYIDRAYGEFSTHQRVSAACGLLKIRTNREVEFDRKPVWNFINGTLELDTGVFRDHNPDDFCSVQADYPYNPDATYDSWSRFIDDITGGDAKTSELLQLIPGYVFFPTCSMERIFVLTGSGGNGKSKYLEILRQLFGTGNVTHITPRGLLDRFQRIKLKNSLVNLAGEIKSDVRDAEEYMKLIASGEPISACFKNQNFVDFIPRTKLVFACNGQLASGDTSEGLARRLLIIDFKMRFVDNPDPNDPYQRLKDINILDHLSEELQSGGIFNWAYEGYKLLQAVGYFTETNDQQSLMDDFKRASNPVLVFWEDYRTSLLDSAAPEFTNQQAYRHYCQWCADNGEKPKTAISFHREFKSVCERDYEPFRTRSERGYRRKIR